MYFLRKRWISGGFTAELRIPDAVIAACTRRGHGREMWKTGFMTRLGASISSDLSLQCPRCHAPVTERFYGPCTNCRNELRGSVSGTARDVQADAYEPSMNVTPNAVATKE